jgi:YVTN family beta-propeller protein
MTFLARFRPQGLVCAVAAVAAAAALSSGCSSSSGGGSAGAPEAGPLGPPGKIYVSMYGDNEITVFDEATRAVLSHIPVGKGPAVLLATPDNKKLYSANWLDNSISAVEIATATSTPIPLDGRPWAIALSPDGKTLYAGLASNKLAVIDTTSDTLSKSFDTSPDFPESVVVSADGSQVYIDPTTTSNTLGAGSFESLSATDGSVVHASLTVGTTPAWASISPDGTRAYTLNFIGGSVSVIDTTSWQNIATIATGSGSQPIISTSTAQGLLVVTDFGTGNLKTIDFKTNTVLHTLALDGRPVGVGGYNADGTLGYVVDFGHASLGVAETITFAQQFSNGDLSGFVKGRGHLTAFDPATGTKIGASVDVGHGPTSLVVVPK